MTLDELNQLGDADAIRQFLECCGAREWAVRMMRQRPYADETELLEAAERAWTQLNEHDWLEAFAAHPRIGQQTNSAVSQREQASVLSAEDSVRQELASLNREYEEKHGFIFIVFASGKTPEQILELLRARMNNDRAAEIQNAAAEQLKIIKLRLQRLLGAT